MSEPSLAVTEDSLELLSLAIKARDKAHVPYSKFMVGVALRTRAGTVHAGCNIENASYPEGWCAETSAISAMIMASDGIGSTEIEEMVVVAEHSQPITPCGGCRQRIKEFGTPETVIHSADLDGIRKSFTLAGLLPAAFDLKVEE